VCLEPFDEIAYKYEYVVGMEPCYYWARVPSINSGFMAVKPGHPIAKNVFRMFEEFNIGRVGIGPKSDLEIMIRNSTMLEGELP